MNKTALLFLGIAAIIVVGFLFYRTTFALFSDTANSNDNVFAAAEVFPTATPSATPTPIFANHLVISEVQINGGPSLADQDFIELYNPTNSSIDLNGYRLIKRTGNNSTDDSIKSWTSTAIVPPHSFYLWASTAEAGFAASIGADASTSATLTNSSSIGLRQGPENTGTLIDSVSWTEGATIGEGAVFSPNPGGGESVERKALSTSDATSMTSGTDALKGNGFDGNNNATDFILRTASQPQNSASATESP